MALSWLKCSEKERYFVEQRRHCTVNSQQREEKKLFRSENSNTEACVT